MVIQIIDWDENDREMLLNFIQFLEKVDMLLLRGHDIESFLVVVDCILFGDYSQSDDGIVFNFQNISRKDFGSDFLYHENIVVDGVQYVLFGRGNKKGFRGWFDSRSISASIDMLTLEPSRRLFHFNEKEATYLRKHGETRLTVPETSEGCSFVLSTSNIWNQSRVIDLLVVTKINPWYIVSCSTIESIRRDTEKLRGCSWIVTRGCGFYIQLGNRRSLLLRAIEEVIHGIRHTVFTQNSVKGLVYPFRKGYVDSVMEVRNS